MTPPLPACAAIAPAEQASQSNVQHGGRLARGRATTAARTRLRIGRARAADGTSSRVSFARSGDGGLQAGVHDVSCCCAARCRSPIRPPDAAHRAATFADRARAGWWRRQTVSAARATWHRKLPAASGRHAARPMRHAPHQTVLQNPTRARAARAHHCAVLLPSRRRAEPGHHRRRCHLLAALVRRGSLRTPLQRQTRLLHACSAAAAATRLAARRRRRCYRLLAGRTCRRRRWQPSAAPTAWWDWSH